MAVVALVIMAVAVPIIGGLTTTEKAENTGGIRATAIEEDVTITIKAADGQGIYEATTGQTYTQTEAAGKILGQSFNLSVRVGDALEGMCVYPGAGYSKAAYSGLTTITITVQGGMASIVYGDNTVTDLPCSWIVMPYADGELVLSGSKWASGGTAYWYSKDSNSTQVATARGDPMNAESVTYWEYNNSKTATATGHPTAINYGESSGVAKQIGSATIAGTKLTNVNIYYVPFEYSIESKSTTDTLVDLIPLLMIVGLMVAVVVAYVQWRE